MSHFSKHVTGSTRLATSLDDDASYRRADEGQLAKYEFTAYEKGDSIIVMAINATESTRDLKISLPKVVKSGELLLSTGNESDKLCQKSVLDIAEPTDEFLVEMPALSLSTYIYMIDKGGAAIENVKQTVNDGPKTYYDLQGRRLDNPQGLCIERSADGSSRKVLMGR